MILADFFLGLPELLGHGFHSSHRFHSQWQWRPKLSRLKLELEEEVRCGLYTKRGGTKN